MAATALKSKFETLNDRIDTLREQQAEVAHILNAVVHEYASMWEVPGKLLQTLDDARSALRDEADRLVDLQQREFFDPKC